MRRPDYTVCYDTGRRYFSKNFILFAALRSDGAKPRLGVAVSRKVGSAVRRNRVKRLVREWFRLDGLEMARSASDMPQGVSDAVSGMISGGVQDSVPGSASGVVLDIVVVAKRGIDVGALDFEGVAQELSNSVRKVLKDLAGIGRASRP